MRLPRRAPTAFACLAIAGAPAALAQAGSEDPGNNFYRYDNTQLEAVCNAMSPRPYASGLTDGGWGALGWGGRTYYYRSACYLELVRRTGRVDLCPRVVERRTLFGDGSSHTPETCAQVAAQHQAEQQRSAAARTALDQAVQGALRISGGQVQLLPSRNWRVEIDTEGHRAGDYILEVVHVRSGAVLQREDLVLTQPRRFVWELERQSIVGTARLPDIFPMVVRMRYRVPATPDRPATEHGTGMYNFTLSAE